MHVSMYLYRHVCSEIFAGSDPHLQRPCWPGRAASGVGGPPGWLGMHAVASMKRRMEQLYADEYIFFLYVFRYMCKNVIIHIYICVDVYIDVCTCILYICTYMSVYAYAYA